VQEEALLKEICLGTQWRIDAVAEAITQAKNWGKIDSLKVFQQIGVYGRLTTLRQFCESNPRFKQFRADADKGFDVSDQIRGAFDKAVLFGHFAVADYCQTFGECTGYLIDRREPRAMYCAVDERNERKMEYLLKAGENPSYHLIYAIQNKDRKTFDFL